MVLAQEPKYACSSELHWLEGWCAIITLTVSEKFPFLILIILKLAIYL